MFYVYYEYEKVGRLNSQDLFTLDKCIFCKCDINIYGNFINVL